MSATNGPMNTSPRRTSASVPTPRSSSPRSQADAASGECGDGGRVDRHGAAQRQNAGATTPPADDAPTNLEPPPEQPAKHEVQVDYEPPAAKRRRPRRQPGPARRRTPDPSGDRARGRPAGSSDTLRELAFLDRINEIGPADQLDGASAATEAVRRGLHDPRAARPRRARATQPDRPRRATGPRDPQRQRPAHQALPPRPDRPPQHRPARTHHAPTAKRRCCTR